MNDPTRLVEDDGTPFERSLLSALRDERPSPDLELRMRQGLAMVGVTTAGKVAFAGWLKVAVASAVAASVGAGVAVWERRHEKPPAAEVRAAPPPPVSPAPPVAPPPEPASTPVQPAAEPVSAPLARARPAASSTRDLSEEIRLLDEVRAAVRDAAPKRALKILATYDRRFPRGQFQQEAQVLRVEALEKSGKKQAAHALGKKFLEEHPESPHVERVESVTGSSR